MFGLSEEDIKTINTVIGKHNDVEEALIFGSRAKGNYKKGSDVDIVLNGEKITRDTILTISSELNNETIMPFRFDVLNFNTIKNEELVAHIQRVGKTVYRQTD
jgi:predicted nucleotidyltransferase